MKSLQKILTVSLIVVLIVVTWLLLNRTGSSVSVSAKTPISGGKAAPVVTVGG